MAAAVTETAAAPGLLQLMLEVSQRMQVRHPNIATVMGVSTEPVTEDPLLVRYHHIAEQCIVDLDPGSNATPGHQCFCAVPCASAPCHVVQIANATF